MNAAVPFDGIYFSCWRLPWSLARAWSSERPNLASCLWGHPDSPYLGRDGSNSALLQLPSWSLEKVHRESDIQAGMLPLMVRMEVEKQNVVVFGGFWQRWDQWRHRWERRRQDWDRWHSALAPHSYEMLQALHICHCILDVFGSIPFPIGRSSWDVLLSVS